MSVGFAGPFTQFPLNRGGQDPTDMPSAVDGHYKPQTHVLLNVSFKFREHFTIVFFKWSVCRLRDVKSPLGINWMAGLGFCKVHCVLDGYCSALCS